MVDDKEQRAADKLDATAGVRRPRWLVVGILLVAVLAVGVLIVVVAGGDGGRADADASDQAATAKAGGSTPTTLPPAQSGSPAQAGTPLTDVATPPSGTLAMVDATTIGADAVYEVTFKPYGYGPAQGGGTLVISVSTSTPMNASAEAFDFAGRNVLAAVVPGGVEVTQGGTYTAILGFRTQGDLLAPVLREVALAE